MRYLELCEKEVINVNDCSYIGHIQDMVLDMNCGKICEIIIIIPVHAEVLQILWQGLHL